jgi:hypothetical protein
MDQPVTQTYAPSADEVLVICLDGGLVTSVVSRSGGQRYVVVDYDTDGVDDADLTQVPQGAERPTVAAYVTSGTADVAHPEIAAFGDTQHDA